MRDDGLTYYASEYNTDNVNNVYTFFPPFWMQHKHNNNCNGMRFTSQ